MKTCAIKKGLLLAVVMAVCAGSPALAAMPKAESTVMNGRITLGDVFEGVKDNADYYLAPAPDIGKTVTLNTQDLMRISEAFNLGWAPDNDLRPVVIRRSSGGIYRQDIEAAVQKKLAEELKGQKLETELFDNSISLPVPDHADKTLQVESLDYDDLKGEFKATVAAAALPGMKKEVKGRFYRISQLPVLKEPLRQGDVIGTGDIDYIDIRAADITASMIVDAGKLVGQTPRRGIAAMKPVTAGDVRLPVMVKKGDLVTMLLKSDLMSLTAQGRALDSGSAGDAIQVMNTSSRQVVEAVITGPQAVSIRPPLNML